MILDQQNYLDYRKAMGNNLFNIVVEHKKNCKFENCNVSLYLLADLYCELIGRDLTKGERKVFF